MDEPPRRLHPSVVHHAAPRHDAPALLVEQVQALADPASGSERSQDRDRLLDGDVVEGLAEVLAENDGMSRSS